MSEEIINTGQLKDSFKLTKNSRGYSWEITVREDDWDKMQEKLHKMNNFAFQNWGGDVE